MVESSNKIRVYLDYNIYDRISKNIIDDVIFKNNKVKVFLSVAHAEEYYKACKNDVYNKNYDSLNAIFNEMILLTSYGILNPSTTRIKNENEKFNNCLKRIKKYDTTEIVISNGAILNETQKESVDSYVKGNNKVKNYSNLSFDEIWKQKEVIQKLEEFESYIDEYKKVTYRQISYLYGINQAVHICNINNNGFELKSGCYSELENNYSLLECVIEFLHNILGECGYNRDKKLRTSISGIHDVQHSIYATYCDYFISEDKTFSKRTNAIYTYLGVKTKVIDVSKFEGITQSFLSLKAT